jgi:hypothetical protein
MPITFGIYDFFSYFVPGLLYLFVVNEFLRIVGWKFVNFVIWFHSGQAPNIILLVPIVMAAYIIGHILDPMTFKFFFGFIYRIYDRRGSSSRSLEFVKENYPTLKVKFEPKDWNILFTILRQRNTSISQIIDKFQADSIMLRNIAFGMLVLSLIYIGDSISTKNSGALIAGLAALALCGFSINRSRQFRIWFFTGIFEASLEYGTSVKEVVEFTRKEKKAKGNVRSAAFKKKIN